MEAGSQLGNYVIKDRLGRGATAEVFRALQPAIDRDVAIKVMFPHLTDSPDFSARFQREARAMGQLQHPNIGRIIDFEASGERPYMVMEHLDGGSLQDLMQATGGPLPIRFALQVTRQLADALRYAHSMGMVHRDIKPANVMFTDDTHQCSMLMDFGMARLVDESMTATGAILGTPAFMAPEQMRGEVVGAPADMYSLGVMLYEMVTGRALYEADSVHTLMMKHVEAPVPSARESAPNVSEDLDSLLRTTLAKQPEDRFSDAGEMVAAIDRLLGSSTLDGSGGGRDTVMQTGAAVSSPTSGGGGGSRGGGGTSRAGLIAAIVAVALIAAGTVFAMTRGGGGGGDEIAGDEVVTTSETVEAVDEATAPEAESADEAPEEPPNAAAGPEPAETEPTETEAAPSTPSAPVDIGAEMRAGFDPAAAPAFFPNSAQIDGGEFVLAWDRTRPAPNNSDYQVNIDDEPVGIVTVDADGRGTMRAQVPAHLASTIRIAAVDPATGEAITVVHENTMSPQDRATFDNRLALVVEAERELAIAIDHTGFISDELGNGDLDAARRHTEHVINIIDGTDGPLFGDLDNSGLAENPGDGVGVLAYLAQWNADGSGDDPDQQIATEASAAFATSQAAGVQLLSSDSVDEASRAFESLSLALEAGTVEVARAKASLRNQAAAALVGPALELTGTDTSTGTIAVLASTGQIIVSTPHVSSSGDISVQSAAGDFVIPPTGSVTIDAGADLMAFGQVVLVDGDDQAFASGALNEAALVVHQQLTTSVLPALDGQAQLVADHADLMRQEVAAGNHGEVRRHAEHVVNIIGGEQGAQFGDLDGDGAAQNPGDGVGVLVYLDQVDTLLNDLPTATVEQRFHSQTYRSAVSSIRAQLMNAQAESLRILATDSAPEAEAPMNTVLTDATSALVGADTDNSGAVDLDESGIRSLAAHAAMLLSSPIEP